jgi:hypothetical protein
MSSAIKLITITVPHVGSTLVANINTGMLEPGQDIFFNKNPDETPLFLTSNRLTLKTHGKVDAIIDAVKKYKFEHVYFVTVNRDNHPQIHHNSDNLIILDYNRLLYRSEHLKNESRRLEDVVDYIAHEYNQIIPGELFDDRFKLRAIDRITKMDERYSEIKEKPFKYCDKHYHIHGSHRGRKR